MPTNTTENTNQKRCHRCHCAAHCDDRLCGNCKQCSECDCWQCLHKKIPPFATQIYSVNQSINIVMIECVCELCTCEHHCKTECFECLECGTCACEHCKDEKESIPSEN